MPVKVKKKKKKKTLSLFEKDYIWNSAACSFINGKYSSSIFDD